jgi:oligopeptide transport system ATP-binding protein
MECRNQPMTTDGPLLKVEDLQTTFPLRSGSVRAVDGVSFSVGRGETVAIVGESGSGKSVLGLSLLQLVPPPGRITGGEVWFDGIDLLRAGKKVVRGLRGSRMALIPQDPMASLNPFMKVSAQMAEVTALHLGHSRAQAREHAVRMLGSVGIPDAAARIDSHPHEFSGGMRQRVMIAMALSCEPQLLIADEPTTALDVTIQAQILELIRELRTRARASVILITHDLGVVAGTADRVMVMYAGRVFETTGTAELFSRPSNPYTRALLKSIPDVAHETGRELYQIPGIPPDLSRLPPGCPFAVRCERAEAVCSREFPPFVEVSEGHQSLCHFAEELYAAPDGPDGAGPHEKQ